MSGSNDMWIEIDFGDTAFEDIVLDYVHRLIGRDYSRLAKVVRSTHC